MDPKEFKEELKVKSKTIASRKILVLEADSSYSQLISKQAKTMNLELIACTEIDDFTEKAKAAHYDFALVNFDLEIFQTDDVVEAFDNRPMVVMSKDALVHMKQDKWPASIAGFISKSATPKDILNAAVSMVPETLRLAPDKPIHFLLIDDDVSFGKVVTRSAEQIQVKITHVVSLDDLKKNISLDGFDAVVLDYDLETTTGFAVAEILNTTARNKPVIMVSSTNRPSQDHLSHLPNIIGFVSKWSSPQEFLTKTIDMFKEREELKISA